MSSPSWKRIKSIGGRGHTVAIGWRGDVLYLRWWSAARGANGNYVWQSLEHDDLERAETEAKAVSASLLTATRIEAGTESVTLEYLFARYEADVTPTKSKRQQKADARRIDIWTAFLGASFDPMALSRAHLKRFEQLRRDGKLQVPGRNLQKVRNRSVQADEAFLNAVLNWASSLDAGTKILPYNPMAGYTKPRELNPRRPRASWDVFVEVRKVADQVDRQKLFAGFLGLVEALGWRVSAVCQIRGSDIDRRRFENAPHGRLRKREESDKVGVDQWVPLSEDARAALDLVFTRKPVVGDAPLFPAPRSKGRKPWSRHRAYRLLQKAYEAADVPEEDRVGWHGYRRKWVDERKHHPRADVAAAGGWLSERTLEIYEQPDEETMLKVVSEDRKLRRQRRVE